jgi:hypothetical protein
MEPVTGTASRSTVLYSFRVMCPLLCSFECCVILCDMGICVLCLIVVPLPQGKNPFAVQLHNNNKERMEPGRPPLWSNGQSS